MFGFMYLISSWSPFIGTVNPEGRLILVRCLFICCVRPLIIFFMSPIWALWLSVVWSSFWPYSFRSVISWSYFWLASFLAESMESSNILILAILVSGTMFPIQERFILILFIMIEIEMLPTVKKPIEKLVSSINSRWNQATRIEQKEE